MERKLYRSSLYSRVLITAVVLLVATLAVSLYTQRRAAASIDSVHQAHVILGELYELNARLNLVETFQRGYILTGDDRYLKTYRSAKVDVDRQLDRLRRLTDGHPERLRQIGQLSEMTAEKIAELDRGAAMRAEQGFSAAQAIERSDVGRELMDGMRAQVREMIADGKQALDERRRTLSTSFARTNLSIASAGLVTMGIACVGALLLSVALRAARREERLERQKVRAERADLQKSRFLANMSHEIRTPMNAILGFGELLDGTVTDPKARRYVAAIRSSGESLLSLINDILDLSKVEAGRLEMHPAPASMHELADGLRLLFAEEASRKGLAFEVTVSENAPKLLVIDNLRLRQIFMNLLSNAIKFTSEGSVRLHLWTEGDPKKGQIDLIGEVADTGCGIPLEEQKRVFQPFRQAHGPHDGHFAGTGLGLSICQRLAALMGGEITLESRPGSGSRFRLRLPDVALPEVPEAKVEGDGDLDGFDLGRLKPSTIVVADDNRLNQELMAELFEATGHEIHFARDGREAVETTALCHPDVVLMDIRMPVMDGREAREALRQRPDTADIPVIAVTASSMSQEEQELRRLFDGFIRKPFQRADVVQELSRFLGVKEAASGNGGEEAELEPGDDPILWPTMLPTLKAWANGRVEELSRVMAVSAVTEFAEAVESLGRDHRCRALARYGRRLREAAHDFHVDAMEESLGMFNELVDAIERRLGERDEADKPSVS